MGGIHRIAEQDEDIPYRVITPIGLASLSSTILGTKNPNVKLTEDDVRAIRVALKQGVRSGLLAAQYKVTKTSIKSIRRGLTWSHLK